MRKGRLVFVVGHRKWGKSATLRALADGGLDKRINVAGEEFLIRRMSNDDRPKSFDDFIKKLKGKLPTRAGAKRCNRIIAFCPTSEGVRLLGGLKRGYRLFFWAIQHQYKTGCCIPREDLSALRPFGHVETFDRCCQAEAAERAGALRAFIVNKVLA